MISLSGTITDPLNQPTQATIRLILKGVKTPYYNQPTDYVTNSDGSYNITVNYGTYDIYIKSDRKFYLIATAIKIDDSTVATSINDLVKK
tara:strand:- start:394 stop:663 length:270 start_codon:yes stop_codon:yes gene_type:complete